MGDEHELDRLEPVLDAFIAELRHWREVSGYSQKALADLAGYTPSYVSKVECAALMPSHSFVVQADQNLHAGGALIRRWKDARAASAAPSANRGQHQEPPSGDPQSAPSTALIVEHEHAELTYRDGVFHTRVRRQLHNVGSEPVLRYLIRVAVDRHPGDSDRSNRLYRQFPLTWEEIGLKAWRDGTPMTWRVKHDRDAFKEVWLLFENRDERFPLYPGEMGWVEYVYTVNADKWGPWWQRAIRLPTRRMSLTIDFPAALRPVVWGIETSMTAEASAFRTPICHTTDGDRVRFAWSIEDPPLYARYRTEWNLRAPEGEESTGTQTPDPVAQMRSLGILQAGDPLLAAVARPFELPDEAEDARRVIVQLVATLEWVGRVHTFAKGMGLAAPQIGIGRSAAVIRSPDGQTITLLNPRVIQETSESDEQYEGCLSFFDVRGIVPRPLSVEVEHRDVDGGVRITRFAHGIARLVSHEVDHLWGRLYRSRMLPGAEPIPVSQYEGTGSQWTYHRQNE